MHGGSFAWLMHAEAVDMNNLDFQNVPTIAEAGLVLAMLKTQRPPQH